MQLVVTASDVVLGNVSSDSDIHSHLPEAIMSDNLGRSNLKRWCGIASGVSGGMMVAGRLLQMVKES